MVLNAILDSKSLIIIGIFLLVTLVVGLYAGRNVKDFKDYVLGGRRFSTLTLILTLLATNIGSGSYFGAIKSIFSDGIIATISTFGIVVHFLFMAYFVPKKIIKFRDCITIGDVMGNIYNERIKIIVGFFNLIYTLCIGGSQIVALGYIFNVYFGINNIYGIFLSSTILGIYTALGGIKSVTFTDVFQFLTLVIIFPLMSFYILNKAGGYGKLLNSSKICFDVLSHKNFSLYLLIFLLWCIPSSLTDPPAMQRNLMAKTASQIKNSYLIRSVFIPVFRISIMIIGLSALTLFPNVSRNDIFISIINIFQNSLFKGLIICSFIGLIMSTADSYLHASSVIIVNDIFIPLTNKSKKIYNKLLLTKIMTVLISIVFILIAIKIPSVFKLTIFVVAFVSPLITVPLLSGLSGIKSSNIAFFLVTIITLLTFIVFYYVLPNPYKLFSSLIGSIVNFLLFFLTVLIQNKGIAIINREYDQNKPQRIWKPTWQGFLETLFSYIPTPHKIFEFSRKSVSRCGANNMLFGIFVCINFIVPYFMWDHKNEDLYNLMIYLRFFGGLLGGLLIVKTEWKDFLKPYFPLFWHFTLLYCLPFISTVMFLLTNGSIIWLLNIGTSIFFLIMLTENIVFLTLTPIGIVLGILFYILRVGPVDLSSFGFEVNYQLIYQVVFSSTIGLLFSYRKKIFNSIKGNEGTNLGLAMCHELRNTGLYIYPAAQISLMYLKKYKDNLNVLNKENGYFIKEKDFEYIKEQNQEIERLGRLQKNIVGTFEKLLKEYRDSINDPQNFSMKHIVNQAIDQYIFKPGQKEKLDINLNKDFIAKIPKQVFIFVVDNIIRNSYKHGNPSKIKIWLEENELHIKDNGKGISEREMDLIFKMYFTNGDSSSSGIGLAFAKQIVEGFGGEIWVESQIGSSSYTEFIIKFPKVSEELSEEEIKENMELEIKKNIAKTMKEDGIEESVIVKATGISRDDLQDDE